MNLNSYENNKKSYALLQLGAILGWQQCLSLDLETGCLKLAVVKFLGVQIFKGDHNILIFQPYTCINSSK